MHELTWFADREKLLNSQSKATVEQLKEKLQANGAERREKKSERVDTLVAAAKAETETRKESLELMKANSKRLDAMQASLEKNFSLLDKFINLMQAGQDLQERMFKRKFPDSSCDS
jgi:hypothetical protein